MKETEYIDISQAPIYAGDLVEYYDAGEREAYVFKVLELDQETEKSRVFSVKVVKSTGNLKIGDEHIITLPKDQETKGFVFRERLEEGKTLYRKSATSMEEIIVAALKEYLDSRIVDNFKAPWKAVAIYFKSMGLGPIADMTTEREVSKYLRKIASGHKGLFKSEGGWVMSLKPTENIEKTVLTNLGKDVREVDMAKVDAGIRLLLESGLFGRVKMRNK